MTIERNLGALANSVELLHEDIRRHVEREERWQEHLGFCECLSNRLDDHSKRLRTLERWWAWLVGGLAAIMAGRAALKVFFVRGGP
mgnify:CR=1 FL=1